MSSLVISVTLTVYGIYLFTSLCLHFIHICRHLHYHSTMFDPRYSMNQSEGTSKREIRSNGTDLRVEFLLPKCAD